MGVFRSLFCVVFWNASRNAGEPHGSTRNNDEDAQRKDASGRGSVMEAGADRRGERERESAAAAGGRDSAPEKVVWGGRRNTVPGTTHGIYFSLFSLLVSPLPTAAIAAKPSLSQYQALSSGTAGQKRAREDRKRKRRERRRVPDWKSVGF